MGKPIIITYTTNTVNYIQEGEGVVFVSPDDHQALSDTIRKSLMDDQLCRSLGKRATEIYRQKYSIRLRIAVKKSREPL